MPEFWYDAAGVRLYAFEEGNGDAVILLHGGGGDHSAVWPIADRLSARYRAIAPDLRGSGKSRCGDSLTWDRLADDVAALLDRIGAERAVIGGVSMGTGTAVRFALRFPRRVAALVLVLPVYAGEDRGLTADQIARFDPLTPAVAKARAEGFEAFRYLYRQSPAAEAYFDAMIAEADLASFIATNEFMLSGAQPFASAEDLRRIAAPTLLIPGNDPMHPAETAELYAAKIPQCSIVEPLDAADYNGCSKEIASAIGDFCAKRSLVIR